VGRDDASIKTDLRERGKTDTRSKNKRYTIRHSVGEKKTDKLKAKKVRVKPKSEGDAAYQDGKQLHYRFSVACSRNTIGREKKKNIAEIATLRGGEKRIVSGYLTQAAMKVDCKRSKADYSQDREEWLERTYG